jgi:hypothetical protein
VLDEIGEELYEAGLTVSPEQGLPTIGGHSTSHHRGWRFELEGTVTDGGEVKSPIMWDEEATWENLALVCEILQRHGASVDLTTALHVTVGVADYGTDVAPYEQLLADFETFEDPLYRLADDPGSKTDRGYDWRWPNRHPEGGHPSFEELRAANNRLRDGEREHGTAIDLFYADGSPTGAIQFRYDEGSIEAGVVQTQIKVKLGLVAAAARRAAAGRPAAAGSPTAVIPRHVGDTELMLDGGPDARPDRLAEVGPFLDLVDSIFSRLEDKEQATAVFARRSWQHPPPPPPVGPK